MPVLENLKHEMFAREMIEENGHQSRAYENVYASSNEVARANAPRLLAKHSVRERIAQLLDERGMDVGSLNARLERFADSSDERIGLDATKLAYRLHGAMDDEQRNSQQHLHLHQDTVLNLAPEDKLSRLRDLTR